MTHFNGPQLLITLDAPTAGVLNLSVEINLYSEWKEWVLGKYLFNTETDVNGTTERITYTDHSLHTGQRIFYYNEGGAENIGLVDGTAYYIRADDASGDRNTFELYDTQANAENSPSTVGRLDLTASGVGNGETHRISADNAKFVDAFRTIGGDPLTPGVEAGGYFFLQNQAIPAANPLPARDGWRIISTDADQTINYQGNLVGEDSSLPIINVTTGRSVLHLGLQPVTQRVDEILTQTQITTYRGRIAIDTLGGGTPGTEFPIGTESVPVDNLADALTISANTGFKEFLLRGPLTFTVDPGNTEWTGWGTDSSIAFNGRDISGAHFNDMTVSGSIVTPTDHILFDTCEIGNLTNFFGTMANCELNGTIVLASGTTRLYNCVSSIPGASSPVINGNNLTGLDLSLRGYNGGIRLINFTQNDSTITLGMNTGKINIDASCTNFGDLQARGVATLNNESAVPAGLTKVINTESLVDATDLMLTRQMVAGNATVSVDDLTVTVYDEDATTVIATFSLSADGRIRTRTS